jgi:transposase-like protein
MRSNYLAHPGYRSKNWPGKRTGKTEIGDQLVPSVHQNRTNQRDRTPQILDAALIATCRLPEPFSASEGLVAILKLALAFSALMSSPKKAALLPLESFRTLRWTAFADSRCQPSPWHKSFLRVERSLTSSSVQGHLPRLNPYLLFLRGRSPIPGGKSMSRQTKLNEQRQRIICDCIRQGSTREVAAIQARVDPSTMYDWLRQGRKAKRGKFRSFYLAFQKAEADREMLAVRVIRNGMLGGFYQVPSYDADGHIIIQRDQETSEPLLDANGRPQAQMD